MALRTIFPPKSFYNRSLSLGCAVDTEMDALDSYTFATLISEWLEKISDPFFNGCRKLIKIPPEEVFSVADSGALLYCQTKKGEGTTVVLHFPPWCRGSTAGILLNYKMMLGGALHRFAMRICPENHWVFPIRFVESDWLIEQGILKEAIEFEKGWLMPDSVRKLQFLQLSFLELYPDSQDELIGRYLDLCSHLTNDLFVRSSVVGTSLLSGMYPELGKRIKKTPRLTILNS